MAFQSHYTLKLHDANKMTKSCFLCFIIFKPAYKVDGIQKLRKKYLRPCTERVFYPVIIRHLE